MTSTPPRPPVRHDVRDAVRAEYDARAATYDNALHRDLAAAVAGFCALDDVRDVLDVATGTGLMLRALASSAPRRMSMTGVDISEGMLARARRALPHATLLPADASALPVADDSADLVTCITALHLMPEPRAVLTECARAVRPHGRVVTATFAGPGGPVRPRPFPVRHDRFRTPELLSAVAAEAGLRLVRQETWIHHGTRDVLLLAELAADV